MTNTSLHTTTDHALLTAQGIDPNTRQPREQAVPCQMSTTRHPHSTFNLGRICDSHLGAHAHDHADRRADR